MGFNSSGTKLLLYANHIGINFEKTITIGRQGIHTDEATLRDNLLQFGIKNIDVSTVLKKNNGYCEPFLQLLGAKQAHSIDASGYESATHIYDMNLPLPDALKNKYSVVIDGGSLEHIFNFPTAIKNCMDLLELKGCFLGITPANNYFGHGFYQFSPELYFRVFSENNGFIIKKMFFYNDKKNSSWYEVKDPDEVRSRVILSNNYPSNLFIIAQKVARCNVFSSFPQQSDYEHMLWENKNDSDRIKTNQRKITYLAKVLHYFSLMKSSFTEIGTGNKKYFTRYKA